MISSLINGGLVTKVLGLVFRIFELVLRIAGVFLKLLRWALIWLVTSRLDALLSRIAKWALVRWTSVEKNTIMLIAMQGEYTCNVRYIAEEMLRRKLPYNITWVLKPGSLGPYPQGMQLIKEGSVDFYRAAAKSKIIIQNGHTLQRRDVQKNADQLWLQTWHGSLGLKRLENAGGDEKFYKKMQRLESKQTDYLISNSMFEEKVFADSYWPDVPSLRLGHARNDTLVNPTTELTGRLRTKVLSRLRIKDSSQRLLLFAPTHDDKNQDQAFGNLDFDSLRDTLHDKFGGVWEILIRTHNSNKKLSDKWLAGLPIYCHNASFYPDMQELLVAADVGITDYSSWVCDYILTKKPSFLYGANLREYAANRGFYHEIKDTPFSLATSNKELVEHIAAFNQGIYEKKIEKFLNACECIDDGNSAKRIVDKIEELIRD